MNRKRYKIVIYPEEMHSSESYVLKSKPISFSGTGSSWNLLTDFAVSFHQIKLFFIRNSLSLKENFYLNLLLFYRFGFNFENFEALNAILCVTS